MLLALSSNRTLVTGEGSLELRKNKSSLDRAIGGRFVSQKQEGQPLEQKATWTQALASFY